MSEQDKQELQQFEALIQGLIDHQFGCINEFLAPDILAGLRETLYNLNAFDGLKSAGIGNNMLLQHNKLVRNDKIHWLEEAESNHFEKMYLDKIWRFIHYLNATCYSSIQVFESHYANYEVGSFYKRHIDQFKSEKGRKFSVILYLNPDWKEEDGGSLALYPQKGEQINILPVEGRLVFFKSDEMEHEVYPSLTRERSSIAGWMKN